MTLDRPSRRKAISVINTIYLSLYSSIHYIQQVNNKCKIEKKQKSFFKPIVKTKQSTGPDLEMAWILELSDRKSKIIMRVYFIFFKLLVVKKFVINKTFICNNKVIMSNVNLQ